MVDVITQIGADDLLLFATDYPHGHTADPLVALLPNLPEGLARKIRGENARILYGLG